MSPKLIALRDELLAAQNVLGPQIEGLRDFARLNLQAGTQAIIQEVTAGADRRMVLVSAALEAINNLSADSYPELPAKTIDEASYNDLAANVTTIQAAFGKFAKVEEAANVEIEAGMPEPKP